MASEDVLKQHYLDHREACAVYFFDALCAAGIQSYIKAPRAPAVAGVALSFDALVEAVVRRQPEEYVKLQEAIFAKRIAAGIALEDIIRGLTVARGAWAWLTDSALGESSPDNASLKARGQRYLLTTQTTLMSMVTAKPPTPTGR